MKFLTLNFFYTVQDNPNQMVLQNDLIYITPRSDSYSQKREQRCLKYTPISLHTSKNYSLQNVYRASMTTNKLTKSKKLRNDSTNMLRKNKETIKTNDSLAYKPHHKVCFDLMKPDFDT